MKTSKIIISHKTKVGELLDCFPQLESTLMMMSPAFKKLKNPVLRKTVARVATLQQVAVVGGLNVNELVNRLRKDAGQDDGEEFIQEPAYLHDSNPGWVDPSKIIAILDATPVINSGESPMSEILRRAMLLNSEEIFELRTPFTPVPILDILKAKGFKIHCVRNEDSVTCFIAK